MIVLASFSAILSVMQLSKLRFFGAAKRAEMADVEQTKETIPCVTCEASFLSMCLPSGVWCQCTVSESWCPSLFGQIINKRNSVSPRHMSHTPAIDYHF